MESAHWRSYRRHLIIARKTFLGRRRYDVWKRGQLIGTFRHVVEAELHVDAAIGLDADGHEQADPTERELLATLTEPERSMLEAIAQGLSLRATAGRLGLPNREAQSIRKSLFAKIGAENATDALRIGRYGGMADPWADGRASQRAEPDEPSASGRER